MTELRAARARLVGVLRLQAELRRSGLRQVKWAIDKTRPRSDRKLSIQWGDTIFHDVALIGVDFGFCRDEGGAQDDHRD